MHRQKYKSKSSLCLCQISWFAYRHRNHIRLIYIESLWYFVENLNLIDDSKYRKTVLLNNQFNNQLHTSVKESKESFSQPNFASLLVIKMVFFAKLEQNRPLGKKWWYEDIYESLGLSPLIQHKCENVALFCQERHFSRK